MANLGMKGDVYVARFRYAGQEYKKSLRTKDRAAAEAALHEVESVLHRLARGWLAVPLGTDPGDFIASGGMRRETSVRTRQQIPTVREATDQYLENLGHLAASNRSTITTHLRNLHRSPGTRADAAIDRVTYTMLESFIQERLRDRSRTTVRKERQTAIDFFGWAVSRDYLQTSPAAALPDVKAEGGLPPFRTVAEIEAAIRRGGLSHEAELSLWDCLYLSPSEIADIISVVRKNARHEVSYLAHAVPAYTGIRRGELLRLQWVDIDFEHSTLIARSRKQSRQVSESKRRIDLHAELTLILREWRAKRPKGQFVLCDDDSIDALTPSTANSRFWQPLRGTRWCLNSRKNSFKIGFHTYRHSFASNLASRSVDQRIIDGWMGHQTEAMRERYRHLYPRDRQSAMQTFSLLTPTEQVAGA